MAATEAQTRERILLAALELFAERGIAATSLSEVAERAGVTRVTVYRHFADKERLARQAFLSTEQVFVRGLEELKRNPRKDYEKVLSDIGDGLSALPSGDAFARAEELRRLYPAAYEAVQEVRVATLNGLFEALSKRIRRSHRFRKELNGKLFRAIFWELTIDLFEKPRFRSLGLTGGELYRGMSDILLHGIIQS